MLGWITYNKEEARLDRIVANGGVTIIRINNDGSADIEAHNEVDHLRSSVGC